MFPRAHSTLALALLAAPTTADEPACAGEPGGPGLALVCAKALVCAPDPAEIQVIDRALVLVSDGCIEAVGPRDGLAVPAGYELIDVGQSWIMPGLIDLHSHVGGRGGLNDTVYQTNPGLRIDPNLVPSNDDLERCAAAGITTVLFIPGSGSNIGGAGLLIKTALPTWGETVVRAPGSLKLAQGDNPARWGYGMRRALMNWVIRHTCRRGLDYARRWREFEAGAGPEPAIDPQYEIFRDLAAGETQISVHTQIPHLVYSTLRILAQELELPVYLDHATIGGWRYGELAEELGVSAIVGPRSVDVPVRSFINWGQSADEGFLGVAAGYQASGHTRIGFNTDAPVIAGEELFLQAAMGARYGLEDSQLATVRGLTVIPALTADLADEIGHLSPGLDADLIVITGHPADPRSHVERVLIGGRTVYDTAREAQRF